MKKIIAAAFITSVAIASCTDSGSPNKFTVSGKIDHATSPNVFLERVGYDNSGQKVVDSGKIAADGSYSLKAVAKEQNLYLLTIDHKSIAVFVNDNSDIKISTDLDRTFRTPYVSNSDATKSIYEFLNTFRSKDSILAVTYNQMDSLAKQNPNDSTILVLQNSGSQVLNDLTAYMKNYIQQSKDPAAIFYALNIAAAKNVMPLSDIDSLTKQATERFKEHAGLAAFRSLLTQAATANANKSAEAGGDYPLLNQQAPDITMKDANGKPLSISSFKGKYLLVDFWASWCMPCRHENPNVVAAYNKFKDKNFTILGISLDTDKSAWLQAVKADNLTWPQMTDTQEIQSMAAEAYRFNGIPFNVLIDPSGKIIAQSLRGPALEQKLAEVLK
ncbi:MAG TPA: TlpA disulfide reductase family protein [Panacibacter sp.]|nr:TlpA disulfide reductase family protein [Panacibacter sp.]